MTTHLQFTYSSWKVFKTCRKQFKHLYILKDFRSLQHEANRYGEAAHKAIEDYIGKGIPMPSTYDRFKPIVEVVKNWKGDTYVELEMAVNEQLEACDYHDRANYLTRGKADLVKVNGTKAKVLDWKFGKTAKYADLKQVELMALLVFAKFPEVEHVRGVLMFMVPDKPIRADYYRKDEKAMWQRWMYEHSVMTDARNRDNFGPNPNNLCKNYCPVLSCDYNGRLQA